MSSFELPLNRRGLGCRAGANALLLAVCSLGIVGVPRPADASTHSGYCKTDTGREFRVDYTRNPANAVVQASALSARANANQPFAAFAEDATNKSRLEWWTTTTYNAFAAASYASPNVTMVGGWGPPSDPEWDDFYNVYWAGVAGNTALLNQPMFEFVSPRVTFRTTNDYAKGEARDEDFCDVFLGSYTPGSGSNPPRVAHMGDSISAQMAPKLLQLHASSGRRYFIEPQSGMRYGDMFGEARGIDAGIRDLDGVHRPPQALTIALGTNEVFWEGSFAHQSDGEAWNAWKTNTNLRVLRVLLDTSHVACRVLMTVRNIPGNGHQSAAADWFNGLIRQLDVQNANIRVVDWQDAASTHASDWYGSDVLHPNSAGLDALTARILQQESCCLNPSASGC